MLEATRGPVASLTSSGPHCGFDRTPSCFTTDLGGRLGQGRGGSTVRVVCAMLHVLCKTTRTLCAGHPPLVPSAPSSRKSTADRFLVGGALVGALIEPSSGLSSGGRFLAATAAILALHPCDFSYWAFLFWARLFFRVPPSHWAACICAVGYLLSCSSDAKKQRHFGRSALDQKLGRQLVCARSARRQSASSARISNLTDAVPEEGRGIGAPLIWTLTTNKVVEIGICCPMPHAPRQTRQAQPQPMARHRL